MQVLPISPDYPLTFFIAISILVFISTLIVYFFLIKKGEPGGVKLGFYLTLVAEN